MIIARVFMCLVLVAAPLMVRAEAVTVFAAASLKEPLDQIAAQVDGVVVSYAGSGVTARQVLLGAPADIVVLAHPVWMDSLVAAHAVLPDSVVDLVGNRLVLVGGAGAAPVALDNLPQALGDGRLAMGFTAAVPAGQYGRAALESLGLWGDVADQLAEVDNVRGALALVARGEAPYGIVYATDARVADVTVVAEFPRESYPAILYQAALTKDAGPGAAAVLRLMTDAQGQEIFAKAGFLPVLAP